MTPEARPLDEIASQLRERLERAPALLACFDYDGTLAPIAPTPEEATLPEGVRARLATLAARRGTEVAVISGRPLEELRTMVALPDLWYVGHHGSTFVAPGEEPRSRLDLERCRQLLAPARRIGEELAGRHPGVRLEDKGMMLALHTRLADAADKERAARAFRAAAEQIPGFEVLHGKEVVEARPRGVDKGSALEPLLARLPAEGLALYVGDDVTDEDAFRRLAGEPRALTVRVGADAGTAAAYWVDDTDGVVDLLDLLAAARADGDRA